MDRLISLVYWVLKMDKKQDTPYFSTCLIVTLIFIVNIISLAVIFNFSYDVFAIKFVDNQKVSDWINTIIQGTIIWMIFFFFFPKKKLEEYEFSEGQLKKGRKIMFATIIISLIIMACLLIKKGIDQGLIK